MYQAGLVLEGGGMKGVYTAGVLDFFLDKEIEFSSCYGVSAGACHLCSYLSKQPKRAYHVVVDYIGQKSYCSVESLITTGDLFGASVCYDLIPNYLNPYDYETFARYEGKAYAVVTNIRTGEAEYLPLTDMHKDIIAVRASSSMPLVSRNVKIGEGLYLDGGIADSIPIRRSIKDGNRKNIVVMTKEENYVREPIGRAELALIRARYLRYPKVYEQMKHRHIAYNSTVEYLEKLQSQGKIFIIRPKQKSDVSRVEQDKAKLEALYEEGYRDAEQCYEELVGYLTSGE
ncbi:MAG: patatin family protein [Blautia sp.]|nr:patatin family protein [Blautia sp.]MCM1218355.1 patatin family protein [Lachnospiraceae bacterium]